MKRLTFAAVTATLASLAVSGQTAAQNQPTTGPIATYWVTAETSAGMGMMGGQGIQKSLMLQLQSSRTTAAPAADHLPPVGLAAGPRLPLATPAPRPQEAPEPDPEQARRIFEQQAASMPKIIIYHGCGESGGAPLTINPSQGMAAFQRLWNAVDVRSPAPPSQGQGRTYGVWPDGQQGHIPASGSLVGDHVVRGNYSPEIKFSLNAHQDFVGAFQLSGTDQASQGRVSWQPVSGAKAILATALSTNDKNEMILWTSSAVPIMMGAVPDMLAQADIDRLLGSKVLLPGVTTQCAIPSGFLAAAPQAMLRMTAYGGEVNFSYPPRPADRRQTWNIEYVTKVRYNSTASAMLGMDARDMAGDADEPASPADAAREAANPTGVLPTPGNVAGAAARALIGGFLRR
ncbi:MAG: hypothetical protein EON91_12500 [Brevundimonas sp.]|uniref:hypothetical protein n=1 Tax=Brevundimonas sp. TaxID=1871086 RepID=UPI00120708E2|nr:hypothetical protein [Brevundimonas sp.]RZJ16609.1 MAG: hypothetical protein EON91_12500 [Brevundimonas sp.]